MNVTATEVRPEAGLHGVTIETVTLPAGNPLRAVCLCGWTSPIVGSRPHAAAAGEEHIATELERGTRSARTPLAPGTCPSWCTTDHSTDFQPEINGRFHTGPAGDFALATAVDPKYGNDPMPLTWWQFIPPLGVEAGTQPVIAQIEDDQHFDADGLVKLAMWLLGKAAELRDLNTPGGIPVAPCSPRLAVWQTEPCPGWCESNGQAGELFFHEDDEHPEDRAHRSSERRVPMRHRHAIKMSDETWQSATLKVLLKQCPEATPIVRIYNDDDALIEIDLRLEEAAELASALTELVMATGAQR